MKRLLSWFRRYRETKRLALVAETAQLVIQQRGSTWTNRTCPNCSQSVSDVANFCQMCGHTFIQELQPAPEPPAYQPYEIERHTSSIHPVMVPKRPLLSARDVHKGKVSSIPTSEVVVPNELQQLLRKAMKRGES